MADRNTLIMGAAAAIALAAGAAYYQSHKPASAGATSPLGGPMDRLSAPANVTVRGISKTAVRVSWSPVPGATKYNIVHPAWMDRPESSVGETNATTIDITGLAPNSPYSVWVQAANATTFGLWGPRSALAHGQTLP